MVSAEFVQQLIEQGHFLEARAQSHALLQQGDDRRMQQLYALALSKSGAPKAAEEFLSPVYQKNPDDPETAGILAGIYKELFKKSQDPQYAIHSRDTYLSNYLITRSTYTGINAAAMSVMAGQASKGKEIARAIVASIDPDTDDPWEMVTLAEAHLLTRNTKASTDQYLNARKFMRSDWGMVGIVYNQLWLLNHYIAVPKTVLQAFHPPAVAAFAGHMIDRPDRKTQRFPSYIETKVKDGIMAAMQTFNIRIGYSSLACGGDIIFCEALASLGGEINIVLGFDQDDFLKESVQYAGEIWVERFEKLVNEHNITFVSHERYQGTRDLFALQSKVVLGSAFHRATLLQTDAYFLTTLSETDPSTKEGGTRDTIKLWPYPQRWININPDHFIVGDTVLPGFTAPDHVPPPPERVLNREVRHLVLIWNPGQPMVELSTFANQWIEENSSAEQVQLQVTNDKLIAAFKGIQDTALFAFKLADQMSSLENKSSFHILVHSGPVTINPAEEVPISGLGVVVMAELSTLTLPEMVYATAPAAMSLSLPPDKYSFEFAGSLESQETKQHVDLFQVQTVH